LRKVKRRIMKVMITMRKVKALSMRNRNLTENSLGEKHGRRDGYG
jgi:hypothetical protein